MTIAPERIEEMARRTAGRHSYRWPELVDDLAQEAALAILEALPTWDSTRGESYLWTCAARRVALFLRRMTCQVSTGKHRPELNRATFREAMSLDATRGEDGQPWAEVIGDAQPTAEVRFFRAQSTARVQTAMFRALDRMPASDRAAVYMCVWEEEPLHAFAQRARTKRAVAQWQDCAIKEYRARIGCKQR